MKKISQTVSILSLASQAIIACGAQNDKLVLFPAKTKIFANGGATISVDSDGILVKTDTSVEWGGGIKMEVIPDDRFDKYDTLEVCIENTMAKKRYCHIQIDYNDGWNPQTAGCDYPVNAKSTKWLSSPILRTHRALDRHYDFSRMRGFPFSKDELELKKGTPYFIYVHCTDVREDGEFRIKEIALTGKPRKLTVFNLDKFFPFVDKYGQFKHDTWPGKIVTDSDFELRKKADEADLASHPQIAILNADRFGGYNAGPQLAKSKHFRTEKLGKKWHIIDPDGHIFFSQGICCVRHIEDYTPYTARENYFEWFPDENDQVFGRVVHKFDRPKRAIFHDDKNIYPYYGFDISQANLIRKYGEDFEQKTIELALRRMASYGFNTFGNWSDIDYFTNSTMRIPYTLYVNSARAPRYEKNEIGIWGKIVDPYNPLFEEVLRSQFQRYKEMGLLDDEYLLGIFVDNELFWKGTDEAFMEQYFSTVRKVFNDFCPDVLYLGCRFADGDNMGNSTAWRIAAKYCDILSCNRYQSSPYVPYQADGIDKPILIGEYHFGALDRNNFHTGLTATTSQQDRANLYKEYVEACLEDERFVGAHWFKWRDQPLTGRNIDGENFQIGIIDCADTPYEEMVTASRELAQKLYASPK